jgi:type 1 glutamine amidotransferase
MRRALMVYGGWDGHEPKKVTEFFAGFLRKSNFEVTLRDSLDAYTDKDLMTSQHLIVQCWTMGELKGPQHNGLLEAVRDHGVGLAGWHGGLCDSFRGDIEYQWMTGGQFLAHPGAPLDYTVNITNNTDPITKGLSDFTVPSSEQYYMMVDPSNVVLATTKVETPTAGHCQGTVMPFIWKRPWGNGRVFFNAVGHNLKDFDVAEARIIMERGMVWAAKE